jgi:hypothetical protein
MVTASILVGGMNVGQSDTLGELFANVNASLTCLGTERFAPFSDTSLCDFRESKLTTLFFFFVPLSAYCGRQGLWGAHGTVSWGALSKKNPQDFPKTGPETIKMGLRSPRLGLPS